MISGTAFFMHISGHWIFMIKWNVVAIKNASMIFINQVFFEGKANFGVSYISYKDFR